MGRELFALETIRIASPCTADWDEMRGDDRVRFCGQCNLHVYNLSGMGREEAEALVSRREGRMCVRMLVRHDGTVLTRDCPVGLRALRKKVWKALAASASLAFALIWGSPKAGGAPAPFPKKAKPNQVSAPKVPPTPPKPVVRELKGDVAFVPPVRLQPAPPPAPAPKK